MGLKPSKCDNLDERVKGSEAEKGWVGWVSGWVGVREGEFRGRGDEAI